MNKKIKLHLGSGHRNFGKDWVHIDGETYDYNHIDSHDIVNLPFPDGTVDVIYASHVIEYFDRYDIKDILTKWYSKLKVGGVLRLAVPDFESMVKLYVEQQYPLDTFLGPLYGRMIMDGKIIYHKTTYDYKSLELLLKSVNFTNIEKYNWQDTDHSMFDDHSQAYIPHMDKTNGILISLNVEAIK